MVFMLGYVEGMTQELLWTRACTSREDAAALAVLRAALEKDGFIALMTLIASCTRSPCGVCERAKK